MKIQPVANRPHFYGYRETLAKVVKERPQNIDSVRKDFVELLGEVRIDDSIEKTEYFNIVQKLFHEVGLKETLETLGSPFSTGALRKLSVRARKDNVVVLATKNGEPVVSLVDEGPYGFFNCLFGRKNKQNQITLSFQDDGLMKGFSLGKKGNYETHSTEGNSYVFTQYHPTGYKEKEIASGYGFPDTTYYNPDGSENLPKTAHLGGPAVPM